MGVRVECDWCREKIEPGTPYVTATIEGKIGQREIDGPARVFCGDHDGCAQRLVALLDGNAGGRVDFGLEWQLVEVGEESEPLREGKCQGNRTPAARAVRPDADLEDFLGTLAPSPKAALARALRAQGVTTLDELDEMTDDELMAMRGIGWKTRCDIRSYLAERDDARRDAPFDLTPSPWDDQVFIEECTRYNGSAYWRLRRELLGSLLSMRPRQLSALDNCDNGIGGRGIRTIGELREAIRNESLLVAKGVGPARLEEIKAEVTWLLEQPVPEDPESQPLTSLDGVTDECCEALTELGVTTVAELRRWIKKPDSNVDPILRVQIEAWLSAAVPA